MIQETWATVKIRLTFPYPFALYMIFRLINAWGFRLIKSRANSAFVWIEIPKKKFIQIFGANPKEGSWPVPQNTETFIQGIEVEEVRRR